MMPQNTRESALRREEFHEVLRHWLDESFDDRTGDPDSHAGQAWLWVRHGGDHFYLSALSTRAGIRHYMNLVDDAGGDPTWSMPHETGEVRDRVAVGRGRHVIDGFEFYRHVPQR